MDENEYKSRKESITWALRNLPLDMIQREMLNEIYTHLIQTYYTRLDRDNLNPREDK